MIVANQSCRDSEGIPAILCGVYTYFFLPDYPDSSQYLSEDEKRAIMGNLPATQPTSSAKTWDWSQAKLLFKDATFPTFTILWICHAIGGWGVSTVLPTVIYELGMTGTAVAQLMTMVSEVRVHIFSGIVFRDVSRYSRGIPFSQHTPLVARASSPSGG